jgi:hypothetical protein
MADTCRRFLIKAAETKKNINTLATFLFIGKNNSKRVVIWRCREATKEEEWRFQRCKTVANKY